VFPVSHARPDMGGGKTPKQGGRRKWPFCFTSTRFSEMVRGGKREGRGKRPKRRGKGGGRELICFSSLYHLPFLSRRISLKKKGKKEGEGVCGEKEGKGENRR